MFDLIRGLPYTHWSQVWKRTLESLNVDGMIEQSCGAMCDGNYSCTLI